jgi:phospholipase/carboxylesterase
MQYGRRAPASSKAKSLVVFLHGYGADGSDLLGLADVLAPHLPDTAFIAPDAPDRCIGTPFGLQWFPIPWIDGSSEVAALAGLESSAASLDGFLDAILTSERLPPSALALFGFSQGAMMALHVAPRRDKAIAGVVAIAGRLLMPESLRADALVKPPVMLIHGDADPVVPFDDMAKAGQALTATGFETYLHVMAGTGHGIAPDGLSVALAFLKDHLPG